MAKSDRMELIAAIASRQWNAAEISTIFKRSIEELEEFTQNNMEDIEEAAQVYEDAQADDDKELWISKKQERLKRYQTVAEQLYLGALSTHDATILREFRSYLFYAAQELGQLLHRGSGDGSDGESVTYSIVGANLDDLK